MSSPWSRGIRFGASLENWTETCPADDLFEKADYRTWKAAECRPGLIEDSVSNTNRGQRFNTRAWTEYRSTFNSLGAS